MDLVKLTILGDKNVLKSKDCYLKHLF